jgi:hypothetical protein
MATNFVTSSPQPHQHRALATLTLVAPRCAANWGGTTLRQGVDQINLVIISSRSFSGLGYAISWRFSKGRPPASQPVEMVLGN